MEVKIINNLCRICLSDDRLQPIFQSIENDLSHKLMACASVHVARGDPLPTKICRPCFDSLVIAYEFKIRCETMDKHLRKLIDDQATKLNQDDPVIQSTCVVKNPYPLQFDIQGKSEPKPEFILPTEESRMDVDVKHEEVVETSVENTDKIILNDSDVISNYNENSVMSNLRDPLMSSSTKDPEVVWLNEYDNVLKSESQRSRPVSPKDVLVKPKGRFVVIKSIIKPQNVHFINMERLKTSKPILKSKKEVDNSDTVESNEVEMLEQSDESVTSEDVYVPEPASYVETVTCEAIERKNAFAKKRTKRVNQKIKVKTRKLDKYRAPEGVSYLRSGKQTKIPIIHTKRKRYRHVENIYTAKRIQAILLGKEPSPLNSAPVIKRARVEKILIPMQTVTKNLNETNRIGTKLSKAKQLIAKRQLASMNTKSRATYRKRQRSTRKFNVRRSVPEVDKKIVPASSDNKLTTISDDLEIIKSADKIKSKVEEMYSNKPHPDGNSFYISTLQTIDQDIEEINKDKSYIGDDKENATCNSTEIVDIISSDKENRSPADNHSMNIPSNVSPEGKSEEEPISEKQTEEKPEQVPAKTGRHTALKSKQPKKRKRPNSESSMGTQKFEIELRLLPRKSERQRSPKKIFPEFDFFSSPRRKLSEKSEENVQAPTVEPEPKKDLKLVIKKENCNFEEQVESDSSYSAAEDINGNQSDSASDYSDAPPKKKMSLSYGSGLSCDVCNKSFPYRSHLIRHVRTHTGLKPYTCRYCPKSYTTLSSLSNHMNNHTGDYPYSCKVCGKGFTQPSVLRRHMNSHTGQRNFRCKICDKAFTHDCSLKTHLKMHTIAEPQYHCEICDKRFKYSSTLTSHIKTHSGIKPFTCPECRKAFYRASLLKRHMRSHTKERPYRCKICKERFAYSGGLSSHLKLHTGIRPFKCTMCEYTFFRMSHLKNHMVKIHNNGDLMECEYCQMKFDSKPLFKQHLSFHKVQSEDNSEM